jgi:hypothetical protein
MREESVSDANDETEVYAEFKREAVLVLYGPGTNPNG